VRPSNTKRWLVGLTLLAVLLFAAYLWLVPLLRIGAGYAAKHACSCHFLQGRELEDIRVQDLNFSVLPYVRLSEKNNLVQASFFGLVDRHAHLIPGRGCVLINDTELPLPLDVATEDGRRRAGAEGDGMAYGLPPNAKLQSALDYGMRAVPGGGARGIVVLHYGELVAERYAEGFDRNTPLLGWSMTKTLIGLLVGRELRSFVRPPGSLSDPTEEANLFPDIWTDDRARITLADLLHMNSGLAWNEGYGSLTDATVMLHERPDFAEFALHSRLVAAPGTEWNYSSGTTNILTEYLSRRAGGNENLYARIDTTLGRVAPSLLIEPDQSGRPVGSSYGWATARDWARLGQLMLQEGQWEGGQLIPAEWFAYMRQPAEGSEGTYGAQLWLPGPAMPSLPPDAFMMRGFQDQRVFVIPSKQLVVARLGHGEDKVTDFDGFMERILAAYD
jgi:CubicO group peptidase (beta-lactamase class C family)